MNSFSQMFQSMRMKERQRTGMCSKNRAKVREKDKRREKANFLVLLASVKSLQNGAALA